jgi:hypothetical protein
MVAAEATTTGSRNLDLPRARRHRRRRRRALAAVERQRDSKYLVSSQLDVAGRLVELFRTGQVG